MRIDPSSISFGMWKDIPVPFYLSVHLFEVLNPTEVLDGAKPILRQRGPYVYRSGTACGPSAWLGCCLPGFWLLPSGGENCAIISDRSLVAQDFKATQM